MSAAAWAAYWQHIFHVLIWGFQHIRGTRDLFRFYVRHHAVAFLRSGFTSESPGSRRQAVRLLWWLTWHHVGPVDW